MPGSAANLGTFTGMPVWGIAPPWQACGFVLLAAAFLLAARSLMPAGGGPSYAVIMQCLAVSALFVSLFLPWNAAPYVRWPDAVIAGVDFTAFWLKVFLVAAVLFFRPSLWAGSRRAFLFCCAAGISLFFIPAG
jgi:hypothetical protein